VRETDDLPATVWWGVQGRHSQFALAQCTARVQESCAPQRYINRIKASIQQTLDFTNASSTSKGQVNILVADLELEVHHQ
jgi:hypothetical protein